MHSQPQYNPHNQYRQQGGNSKAMRRENQLEAVQKKEETDSNYFWTTVFRYRCKNNPPMIPTASPEELFSSVSTNVGINFDQYDAIPVTRSGPDVEDVLSLNDFSALNEVLPDFLMDNLTSPSKMGYSKPTPIQRHCIPLSIDGRYDVMACAQTGSGKTVAFLVPMIASIANQPVRAMRSEA
tara:strand:- start:61 stop:606 length:546 start_codon:yes stop_codon:yes gene_type:complete